MSLQAPEMFKYDEATNKLSLQPGKKAPWLRDEARAKANQCKSWLYCDTCAERYFPACKRPPGHIPYRDRASQSSMRRPDEGEEVLTQDEPEVEPAAESQVLGEAELAESQAVGEAVLAETPPPVLPLQETLGPDAVEGEDDGFVDPLAEEEEGEQLPDQQWPTLEEYQEGWDRKLKYYSRSNDGEFCTDNLVPEPIPQLWQDCRALS